MTKRCAWFQDVMTIYTLKELHRILTFAKVSKNSGWGFIMVVYEKIIFWMKRENWRHLSPKEYVTYKFVRYLDDPNDVFLVVTSNASDYDSIMSKITWLMFTHCWKICEYIWGIPVRSSKYRIKLRLFSWRQVSLIFHHHSKMFPHTGQARLIRTRLVRSST